MNPSLPFSLELVKTHLRNISLFHLKTNTMRLWELQHIHSDLISYKRSGYLKVGQIQLFFHFLFCLSVGALLSLRFEHLHVAFDWIPPGGVGRVRQRLPVLFARGPQISNWRLVVEPLILMKIFTIEIFKF